MNTTPATPVTRLQAFIEGSAFTNFILTVILVNALTMGLQTDAGIMQRFGGLLYAVDQIALVIYIVEILLKFIVYRLRFFRQGWNIFDLVIVGIAIAPTMGPLSVLRTLRTLRALRSLRILSVLPEMRRVVNGLLAAIPGMFSIMAIMGILYYTSAILTTTFFGAAFPEWFGSMGASFYTLFQVMTMESWSMGIARPVMEVYPWAWAFFVPFIAIATFSVLNLFVAVIVNGVTAAADEKAHEESDGGAVPPPTEAQQLAAKMDALQSEMAAIRALLEKSQR